MKLQSVGGRIDPQFNLFAESYVSDIVRAIVVAWSRMRTPSADEIEDHITFRLAGRLQNDDEFRDLPFEVVPQYWLLDLQGRRLGRLDLRFKYMHSHRDYLAFEAKRLHVKYPSGFKTEYSIYISDGMTRFVSGKYAKGLSCAGMIAYVMDSDVSRAWQGAHRSVEDDRAQLRLRAETTFSPSCLEDSISQIISSAKVAETAHDCENGPMVITHLLLPREK